MHKLPGWSTEHGAARAALLAWMITAAAVGVAAYLYTGVCRPLVDAHATQRADLKTQRQATERARREAAAARTELEATREELARAGEDQKKLQDELSRASEAKEETEKLLGKLRGDMAGYGIEVTASGGSIQLTMLDRILFGTGETDLTEPGQQLLRALGKALAETRGSLIQVGGHTDNVPITSELRTRYPTNWELSAARAVNVVRFLSEEVGLDARRLMPIGFGPHRPVASNATAKGRAKNRRIEVLLLPAKLKVVQGEAAKTAAPPAVAAPRPAERGRAKAAPAARAGRKR
jgi:chemotaxis protein MotB